jgi:hypothetical protein
MSIALPTNGSISDPGLRWLVVANFLGAASRSSRGYADRQQGVTVNFAERFVLINNAATGL